MWVFQRKDAYSVWEHEEMQNRLQVYKAIYEGKKLPRYLLAKLFYVEYDSYTDKDALLEIHNSQKERFKDFFNNNQSLTFEELKNKVKETHTLEELGANNYLHLKSIIFDKIVKNCELCENKCRVNRTRGELGRCDVDDKAYLASAFIHMGEESPIVPSGTIFFYGCTMKCVFCQNYDISQEYSLENFRGKETNPHALSLLYENLSNQKARNINFVGGEPTPNLHVIFRSLLKAKVKLPMLWNSNMYLSELSMQLIVDIFDIWLPDMKYAHNDCAKQYSKTTHYWDVLTRNMLMIETDGSQEYIIRHLVMPNHVECCSLPLLEWIKENLDHALVNIMGQYRPEYKVRTTTKYSDVERRPTSDELERVRKKAQALDLAWRSVS